MISKNIKPENMKYAVSLNLVWLLLASGLMGVCIFIPNDNITVSGALIEVDDSGGKDHTTIQAAVDAAGGGDTIFVYNGTYKEHVSISKTITLVGESNNGTIIDAEKTGTGIYITASGAVVKNFRIINSATVGGHSGISLSVSNNCEILNCNITDNDNGIKLWACTDCIMDGNNITRNNGWKGGIALEYSNSNIIRKNRIYDNHWVGIYMENADGNGIDNNTVTNNTHGLMFYGASAGDEVHYNDIFDNRDNGIFVFNTNPAQVDAVLNWWGNATGPYHPTANPQGTGDNVTDHVTFDPWLRSKKDNKPPSIDTADVVEALEDNHYERQYTAKDPNKDELTWTYESNATWLSWGNDNHTLYGTPINSDVGSYWVRINITDGYGGYDEHNFSLAVINRDPAILTSNNVTATEDMIYFNDYDSDDDGQGNILWLLHTNLDNITIDGDTGVVNGTPTNDDVGGKWVNVTVLDGNGGMGTTNFTLNVINENDPPRIVTIPVAEIDQDEHYELEYNATDIDLQDELTWSFQSNASWLHWGTGNNTAFGIPRNRDVGTYSVKVNVTDLGGSSNEHGFNLTVLNKNDPPDIPIINYPIDEYETNTTERMRFVGTGTDPDDIHGNVLNYTWSSNISGILGFGPEIEDVKLPAGVHEITLTVKDIEGLASNATVIIHILEAIIVTKSPVISLHFPKNGSIVNRTSVELSWGDRRPDSARLTYNVFFDRDPNPTEIVSEGQNSTNYTATDLEDGKSYYWTVIPYLGGVKGECLDGVWSFSVSAGSEAIYNISITGPSKITIKQGEKKTATINITNNGDVRDSISLSLSSGGLSGLSLEDRVVLGAGESKDLILMLEFSRNTAPKDYAITIIAVSEGGMQQELEITVTVTGDSSLNKDSEERKGKMLLTIVIIIVVLAILLVAAMAFFTTRRRSKRKDDARDVSTENPPTAGYVQVPSTPSSPSKRAPSSLPSQTSAPSIPFPGRTPKKMPPPQSSIPSSAMQPSSPTPSSLPSLSTSLVSTTTGQATSSGTVGAGQPVGMPAQVATGVKAQITDASPKTEPGIPERSTASGPAIEPMGVISGHTDAMMERKGDAESTQKGGIVKADGPFLSKAEKKEKLHNIFESLITKKEAEVREKDSESPEDTDEERGGRDIPADMDIKDEDLLDEEPDEPGKETGGADSRQDSIERDKEGTGDGKGEMKQRDTLISSDDIGEVNDTSKETIPLLKPV